MYRFSILYSLEIVTMALLRIEGRQGRRHITLAEYRIATRLDTEAHLRITRSFRKTLFRRGELCVPVKSIAFVTDNTDVSDTATTTKDITQPNVYRYKITQARKKKVKPQFSVIELHKDFYWKQLGDLRKNGKLHPLLAWELISIFDSLRDGVLKPSMSHGLAEFIKTHLSKIKFRLKDACQIRLYRLIVLTSTRKIHDSSYFQPFVEFVEEE